MSGDYGGVVFDLFGTLTVEYPRATREQMVRAMTTALGVDHEAFLPPWNACEHDRLSGRITLAEACSKICADLGTTVDEDRMSAARSARRPFLEPLFRTPASILQTLRVVREHKELPLALVSACTDDVPALFAASPLAPLFDVTIFSSEVGLMKPDPAIYRLASDGLGLAPRDCLYIGDGSFGELHGAEEAGMTAALVRTAGSAAEDAYRPGEREWHGEVIGSIPEVLRLLC